MSVLYGVDYRPKSRFMKWVERRLPIVSFLYSTIVTFPVPRNLNYAYAFGAILVVCLIIQIISGVVLAMHYTPHVDLAFESVEHIMRDVNYGWLIRYMHANGASMFFIAAYIHMFRSLYYGSYKNPRELLWIIGVAIYLMIMVTAFLGYLLPWGQISFWGATVVTNLFGAIPFVGEALVTWLRGGFVIDNATLNRFFSLHYLLPFIIVGMVFFHIWALHVTGSSNPSGVEVKTKKDTVPFHPYYTVKYAFAVVLFLILFAVVLFYMPNIFMHIDNFIEADPLVMPVHIEPMWYFLPFFSILYSIPNKLGGILLMFSSIVVLFFLPWLDTSRVRSAAFRPLYRYFFWIFVCVCLGLGYIATMLPEGKYVIAGRVLTGCYFAHFLIVMPLLGFIENVQALPASIYQAVLKNAKGISIDKSD